MPQGRLLSRHLDEERAMKKALSIVGYVLHVLLAALFVFAGSMKLMPEIPEKMMTDMANSGLSVDWVRVIGVGEVVTALLLILPWTFSFGLLMATGLCGGIIATLMTHGKQLLSGEPPIMFGIVLLVVLWVGAWLRDPRTLCTCFSKKGESS
jgi:uncharacterized membrane protein YphA (DoxX/SURF4 family)